MVNTTLIKNFETLSQIVKSFENHESVLRINAVNFDETKEIGFSQVTGGKTWIFHTRIQLKRKINNFNN